MAVQRLSLADIRDRVFQIVGVSGSTSAFWNTDAVLYQYINTVGQNIPIKVGLLLDPEHTGTTVIDFWKTKITSTTVSGTGLVVGASSSTGYLPSDYYHYESFYDLTAGKTIDVLLSSARSYRIVQNLRKKPAGPPEAVKILGMTTLGTYWKREFTILPSTASGVTPSIELVYWRIPASMAGAAPKSEYPDAPVEFHPLWIYGTVIETMARSDPNFENYKILHDEMITALSKHAHVVK